MDFYVERYKDGVRVNFMLYIPNYHIPADIEKIKQIYSHWLEYQSNPTLITNQINQAYFVTHAFCKSIIDSSLRFLSRS